jgi:WD40 repeat protein
VPDQAPRSPRLMSAMKAMIAVALLLATPEAAVAAPTLNVMNVASKRVTVVAKGPKDSDGWSSVRWHGSALIGVIGGEVRRYPLRGRPKTLRDLGDPVDASLSPDGSLVASLDERGVTIREVVSGRRRAAMKQTAEGDDLYENGLALAWARDGSRVAFLGREKRGRTLRVLDTRSGKLLRRIAAKDLYGLDFNAFSPAGDRLVYEAGDYGRVVVLDIASGSRRRLTTTAGEAAWSPVGNRLAISADHGVRLSTDGVHFGPTIETENSAQDLRWSPNGTALAMRLKSYAGNEPSALAVLSVTEAEPRILLPYREAYFGPVVWSPDAAKLAYAG